MANWNTLKAAVADVINANGNQAITGQLLQNVLNNIITNVGENATFAGIATVDTNPGAPDGPVFYLATTAGIYPNFNSIEVLDGEAVILEWGNSTWTKKVTGFATQEKLSQLGSEVDKKYNKLNGEINSVNGYDYSENYTLGVGIKIEGEVGDIAIITNVTNENYAHYKSQIIYTNEGSKFIVSGVGGSLYPTICILGDDGEILYKKTDAANSLEITIPKGGVKLYLNNNTNLIQEPKANQEGALELLNKSLSRDISDLNQDIEDVNEMLSVKSTQSDFTQITNGYYVRIYSDRVEVSNPSSAWSSWILKNESYRNVKATLGAGGASYAMVSFYSTETPESESYIGGVASTSEGIGEYDIEVPSECVSILITNRKANNDNPTFEIYQKVELSTIKKEIDELKNTIGDKCCGCIRLRGSITPTFNERIGDLSNVLSHFKMALVKDGVVQYYINQTNILRDASDRFNSVLNGEDGDMLIVNDVPIYYLIYGDNTYEMKLFSLEPFSYKGISANCINPRGDTPSLCYIENINTLPVGDRYSSLGDGKSHFSRNPNNVASIMPMTYMVGHYVPTETNGVISYNYDESKVYAESGTYRPSVNIDLKIAEKAAINKSTGDVIYTNKDILSRELLLSLCEAEFGTKYINDSVMFGCGFTSKDMASQEDYESDSKSVNGCRFKDANGYWVYKKLSETLFNAEGGDVVLHTMLTDWNSPWEIMEQHLVLSYAKENEINPNTWFVYNGFEYKYIEPKGGKTLKDGVMTAVVLKKFRSKINGLYYDNADLTGNDIEFLICSSVYRGWILDVSPHIWLTGLNVVIYGSNKTYHFFVQHDYRKYIMNKDYTKIADWNLYDFEKTYKYAGKIEISGARVRGVDYTDICTMVIKTIQSSGALGTYACMNIDGTSDETRTNLELDVNSKIVVGTKLGYGPTISNGYANFLYLNHPRDYIVARAGYSSFVCQNVTP